MQHFLWPSLPYPFRVLLRCRGVREELLEVVVDNVSASPADLPLSLSCHLIPISPRSGARVGCGGPCKRDDAPISNGGLPACVASPVELCTSAMDNLFLFHTIFALPSKQNRVVQDMADLAMVVVGVPQCYNKLVRCQCQSWGSPSGLSIWFRRLLGTLSLLSLHIHNFVDETLFVPVSYQRTPSPPQVLKLLPCTRVFQAICSAIPHIT